MENKVKELEEKLLRKEQECEQLKDLSNHNGRVCNERLDKIDELEHNINELCKQLDQEKTLKEMYFTYYKAKHSDVKGEFFKLKLENEKLKKTLNVIANKSCLNPLDCTGHCLPNCKWNAHVLAQQTLKELISEVEDES